MDWIFWDWIFQDWKFIQDWIVSEWTVGTESDPNTSMGLAWNLMLILFFYFTLGENFGLQIMGWGWGEMILNTVYSFGSRKLVLGSFWPFFTVLGPLLPILWNLLNKRILFLCNLRSWILFWPLKKYRG